MAQEKRKGLPASTVELIVVVGSVLVAGLRVMGVKDQSFQAMSHLFVGGLLGGFLALRRSSRLDDIDERRLYIFFAASLSLVELGCFLWFKLHG